MEEVRKRRNREHTNSKYGCAQCKARKVKVSRRFTRVLLLVEAPVVHAAAGFIDSFKFSEW